MILIFPNLTLNVTNNEKNIILENTFDNHKELIPKSLSINEIIIDIQDVIMKKYNVVNLDFDTFQLIKEYVEELKQNKK